VTAEDPYGNTAIGYRGTVHFTSTDGKAVLPANYTFTSTDNGVHGFSATLKTAGTQSINTGDTVTASIKGTEAGITVNPAATSVFVVAGFPSPAVAGTQGSFTVTAKDAFGNLTPNYAGTVHFASSDRKAVLPANYTFTSSDSGIHSFLATLKTAGAQSITATDTVTASIKGSQTGISITPAATSGLSVTGFPSPATAGVAGTFIVAAVDAYGNKTPAYSGTVHFTSSDAKALVPADYAFTSADKGAHTFTNGATLFTTPSQSIIATDTVTSSITGKQTVTVVAAAASTLIVSGFPSPTVAGAAHTVIVTAKDPYGNKATGYRGTIHFTSSDPQAVLPANYTFTASDNGAHSFSNGVTLKTAGTQSITATDTLTSSITGTQSNITVTPAAASIFIVAGFPSTITAGTSASFTVTATDAYGNTATGYRGTVHFTSSDPNAILPANYTFTSTDKGVHTFSAILKTAGTQSITATDTLHSTITGAEVGIQVS
jgi:hypothetical protein